MSRFPLTPSKLTRSVPGVCLAAAPITFTIPAWTRSIADNVHSLQVAWTFDSGDQHPKSEMECNPIVVDGVLYATTPNGSVVALDAATGSVHWRYDATEGLRNIGKVRNRGVTYWADGADRRIFVGVRQYLVSLDAGTGKPVTSFGKAGPNRSS